MKKMKKFLPIILAFSFCLSACASPSTNGSNSGNQNSSTPIDSSVEGSGVLDSDNVIVNNNPPSFTQQGDPVEDPGNHYQTENVLHKVNVTESDRAFVVDKKSEYKILIANEEDSKLVTAATFLMKYIKKATGYELPIGTQSNHTWNENAKWIVLGCNDLFAAAGLTMPVDDIGISGYYIKSAGDSVFVSVKDSYGYHRAVLSLLDHIVGYEMYWGDTVVFEKTGETLPDMDIIERPDFDFYIESDQVTGDGRYGMGFDTPIFISVEGAQHHNTFKYLPPATYKPLHPEWYSMKDGTDAGAAQLCYTARGNAEKYNLLVKTVAEKIISYMNKNPQYSNITFTQEDTNATCGCDACTANYEKYGAYSASIIMFMNDVDDIVQAYLQEQADANGGEKKPFNIIFFAYHKSEKPPVKQDANGEWIPVDENVICNPNVGVYIAPIYSNYLHSFYEEENELAAEEIKGWGKCCSLLYMWIYETNFSYYMYPYNTWDTKVESYRFLKEQGAVFMQSQGQWNNGAATHFTRLKIYMDSKAEFNVNVNFNDIANDWFANYFGPAAEPMRAYFDELQVHLRYLEQTYPIIVTGSVYGVMEKDYLWPRQTLNGYMAYIEKAYEAIESLRESDPLRYDAYKEHITLESLFPRYALLRLYKGTYTSDAFMQEAKALKKDCAALNVTRYRERYLLEEIWAEWGI